jgi:hypothetical protein
VAFAAPHAEQVFEEGYQRSAVMSVPPFQAVL